MLDGEKDLSRTATLKYSGSTIFSKTTREFEKIGLKRSGTTSLTAKVSTAFYGLETYSSSGTSDDNPDNEKNNDDYIPGDGFGDELGDNSIIPEVAASIPITDDTTLPVLTFRVLVISTLLSIFSAAVAQLFFFRYNHITIDCNPFP